MPREKQARGCSAWSGIKKLFEQFSSPFRTPSEHVPASEGAANTPLLSNEPLESPMFPPKEESYSSSTASSQHSTTVPSIIDESFSGPSPANSAVLGSQSQLESPVASLSTSPASHSSVSQAVSDSSEPTPTPLSLSDLWSRAFLEVDDKTQQWIQDRELNITDPTQPKKQIKKLIRLIKSNELFEQNDQPFEIKIGNRKVVVREYIADTVAFLTTVGEAAMTFAPPQASAPWAVAKAVLKIPVKQIEQKAALLGTVRWFTRIVRRGEIYAAIYYAPFTDQKAVQNLYDALLDVYKAALELLASSDTILSSGKARQTLTAVLKPEGAAGKVKDLFEKEERVDREVLACEASRSAASFKQANYNLRELKKQLDQLSSPFLRMDKGVTTVLEKIEEKELNELMYFISSEMFGKSHADVTKKRIEHTGDWLLDNKDFRAWQGDSSSSAVLCLKGTVGTGKTYLTSKVVDYVKQTLATSQHDEGFAFFYCNRSGPSMQDPIIVLRSFVRQLASKAFGEPGFIQSSLAEKCKAAKREGRELGYNDCKTLILKSLNLYSKTTIILDALDESDITTYNLCTILMEMMEESKKPVKIFISTRPDRKYLKAFQNKSTITLDASNQQKDIERFLEKELYTTESFMERSQKAQKAIKHVFVTQSCGMFRWVYLQVRSLENHITDDAVHNWARKLPRTLTEAYDHLWNNMRGYDDFDVDLAERAIRWVLCSFEPLKSEILLEAIQYAVQGSTVVQKGRQTQQQILSLCRDLLTIDEGRGVWMLPHASVAEYFETKGWTTWECDVFASKVCLGVLENFQPGEIEYGTFAQYVQLHWGRHVGRYDQWLGTIEREDEATKADPNLTEALKNFLGSPGGSTASYRNWARSLNEEFMPTTMALFAMCWLGLYHTLRSWWQQEGNITEEMALVKNKAGCNPLAVAALGNCKPICKRLIELTENRLPEVRWHAEALQNAIDANNFDILEFLLVHGDGNVNFPIDENRGTVAQNAARFQPKALQWMVDGDFVDLEKENDSGFGFGNVLIAAASYCNSESVQILLEAKADVNAAVGNGIYGSALAAVVATPGNSFQPQDERIKTARLLLKHGADPNLLLKVGDYGSALEASMTESWAGYREEREKIQLMLLNRGDTDPTDVLERGEHGTALAAAAFWGRKEILKVMINRVGAKRAIQALDQSRHPGKRYFEDEQEVQRWKGTATYLAEEVGISKETLHTIGFWENIEPERSDSYQGKYLLDYSKLNHYDN